jgi:thioredoxin 1
MHAGMQPSSAVAGLKFTVARLPGKLCVPSNPNRPGEIAMAMTTSYTMPEPARSEIDQLAGSTVIEFGTPWCSYCIAAQAPIAQAMDACPDVQHIKVEDGKGLPLGRSFRIKLWPTLIFLRDGREVARLVRPTDAASISRALADLGSTI